MGDYDWIIWLNNGVGLCLDMSLIFRSLDRGQYISDRRTFRGDVFLFASHTT